MKKTNNYVLALLLAANLIPMSAIAQGDPVPYALSIRADDLKKHLTLIASDSLKGRNTGSAEQLVAANYIADSFKKSGIAPVNGSYFQKVDLVNRSWTNVSLAVKGKKYEYLGDFMASALAPVPANSKFPVVFVGFGIQQGGFTDFDKLNAKVKYVLAFEGESKDSYGN